MKRITGISGLVLERMPPGPTSVRAIVAATGLAQRSVEAALGHLARKGLVAADEAAKRLGIDDAVTWRKR